MHMVLNPRRDTLTIHPSKIRAHELRTWMGERGLDYIVGPTQIQPWWNHSNDWVRFLDVFRPIRFRHPIDELRYQDELRAWTNQRAFWSAQRDVSNAGIPHRSYHDLAGWAMVGSSNIPRIEQRLIRFLHATKSQMKADYEFITATTPRARPAS